MSNKKIIFMGTPYISSIYLDSLIKNKQNIIAVYSQPPKKKRTWYENTTITSSSASFTK